MNDFVDLLQNMKHLEVVHLSATFFSDPEYQAQVIVALSKNCSIKEIVFDYLDLTCKVENDFYHPILASKSLRKLVLMMDFVEENHTDFGSNLKALF